jgi:predicted transcriptional regulator
MAMTPTAGDLMTPPDCVLDAGEILADAIEETNGKKLCVVTDGDEVVGVLDRADIEAALADGHTAEREFLGNLVVERFRLCRPEDDAAYLARLLDGSSARLLVVTQPPREVLGVIYREQVLRQG